MEHSATHPQRSAMQSWVVCMTAALCFFYIFIQMTKFNAIGPELMADFKITSTGLGTLSSMYFWGNLIFLFPAGLLLDRFSTKRILIVVMLVTAVCAYLVSFTDSVGSASWLFLLTGIAGSFALIIPLRLASRWFLPEKMALASGMSITVGFFGAMVSQYPMTILVNHIGWRTAMQLNAGLGILILLLMIMVVKDFPEGVTREMSHEQATSLSFLWYSLKKAVCNSQNWLFGLYTCLVNLPIFIFSTFGTSYLQQVHNLPEAQAAFATTLLFLGAMAGSPAFGWLSDKMKKRKLPMYYGALISLALLLVIMYFQLNYLVIYALFFGMGFFTSAQVITYPVIAESNPGETIATGFSMGSTLIMSGGAFIVPLFGWLLDLNSKGNVVNGIQMHSQVDYRLALWMLVAAFVISIVTVLFGKETNCQRII